MRGKQAGIALPCTNFTVIRLPDNTVVFSGKATAPAITVRLSPTPPATPTTHGWISSATGISTRTGTGDWYDTGDYNKYTVNAGVTVGVKFRAWEDFGLQIQKMRLAIPESGGPLMDYLAEIKWELDWLFKMQTPDGSVYHKLSARHFSSFIVPERDTAHFVGIMAHTARIYRSYDPAFADHCLKAAEKSHRFPQTQCNHHQLERRAGLCLGCLPE